MLFMTSTVSNFQKHTTPRRNTFLVMVASLFTLALAACGGSSPANETALTPASAMAMQARALRVVQRQAPTPQVPVPADVFDWAEQAFPQFFPGHPNTQVDASALPALTYRYYADTGNYLATAGGNLVVKGPFSGNAGVVVGQLADFACFVYPAHCGFPNIVQSPRDVEVPAGATVFFSVDVAADATQSALSFQWQVSQDQGANFSNIQGATDSTLARGNLSAADSGSQFRVIVTNGNGSVASKRAVLTVKTRISVALSLAAGASAATVQASPGDQVIFKAVPPVGPGTTYQWLRAGTPIAGAVSDTLVVDPVAVADDGLVYAVAATSATGVVIRQTAALTVAAPLNAKAITSCREINQPGSYFLQKDLVLTSIQGLPACLQVHDTSAVQLDCRGHLISQTDATHGPMVSLTNVKNFSLKNCVLTDTVLNVLNSSNGSITHNNFAAPAARAASNALGGDYPSLIVSLDHSDHIVMDNNDLIGSFQLVVGTANTISNNRVLSPAGPNNKATGLVVLMYGSQNRILGNLLDGGSPGVLDYKYQGADDGIALFDESATLIQGNTIRNVFDCGVEWIGTITSNVIDGNTISNAGYCGVGGWYWLGLIGSTVSNNTMSNLPHMFWIYRNYGLRGAGFIQAPANAIPADSGVYFKDNLFSGNRYTGPVRAGGGGGALQLTDNLGYLFGAPGNIRPGTTEPTAADFHISNNVFKNNDFTRAQLGPSFGGRPNNGFVTDGGGNICNPVNGYNQAPYPLACN